MTRAFALVVVAACAAPAPPSAPVTRVDIAPVASTKPLVVEPAPSITELSPAPMLAPPADMAAPPDGAFDKMKAATALAGVDVQRCARPNGPTGPGHVTVTFDGNGSVLSAAVDSPPFAGTPEGGCIAAAFGTARVPPFRGPPVRVGKSFVIP